MFAAVAAIDTKIVAVTDTGPVADTGTVIEAGTGADIGFEVGTGTVPVLVAVAVADTGFEVDTVIVVGWEALGVVEGRVAERKVVAVEREEPDAAAGPPWCHAIEEAFGVAAMYREWGVLGVEAVDQELVVELAFVVAEWEALDAGAAGLELVATEEVLGVVLELEVGEFAPVVIEADHIQPHEDHNSEAVEQRAVPAVAEPVVAFVLPPGAEQATIVEKGKIRLFHEIEKC